MSSLKEYIKQLAREIMSEESSTGDIGGGAGFVDEIGYELAIAAKIDDISNVVINGVKNGFISI